MSAAGGCGWFVCVCGGGGGVCVVVVVGGGGGGRVCTSLARCSWRPALVERCVWWWLAWVSNTADDAAGVAASDAGWS